MIILQKKFCYENNIKILGKIPFDSKLGTLNSNGEIIVNIDEKYKEIFSSLLDTVIKEVRYETVANP